MGSVRPEPPLTEPSDACMKKVSDFEESMLENLERNKSTFGTVTRKSQEIWQAYIAWKKGCQSDFCKHIFKSLRFEAEMSPEHYSSTPWIGRSFTQDIVVLGESLALANKIPKANRKESDLNGMIDKMGWSTDNAKAATLKKAYLTDETFSDASSPRSLLELTLQLGIGRLDYPEDSYTIWLNNGIKDLKNELKRLESVYINPKDATFKAIYRGYGI